MARKVSKRGPGRFSQANANTNVIEYPTQKPRSRPQVKLLPRNVAQEDYLYALANPDNSIVFAIGPAGTGKTMLATQWAIKGLISGEFKKIVISRPNTAVDDQDIGFLPGGIMEKMMPWVLPILDVFKEYYTLDEIEMMIKSEIIEICPIAYIRGRTFKNAVVLIDEAQNTTENSMLSILTRIGENSKMVITGDIAQSDRGSKNGLQDFLQKVNGKSLKYIEVVQFAKGDVERHEAVKEILDIYGKKD